MSLFTDTVRLTASFSASRDNDLILKGFWCTVSAPNENCANRAIFDA